MGHAHASLLLVRRRNRLAIASPIQAMDKGRVSILHAQFLGCSVMCNPTVFILLDHFGNPLVVFLHPALAFADGRGHSIMGKRHSFKGTRHTHTHAPTHIPQESRSSALVGREKRAHKRQLKLTRTHMPQVSLLTPPLSKLLGQRLVRDLRFDRSEDDRSGWPGLVDDGHTVLGRHVGIDRHDDSRSRIQDF